MNLPEIMAALIKNSIDYRLSKPELGRHLSPWQYAYEYKTVGVNTHRMAGKTSWVMDFCNKTNDRCLIIVPHHRMLCEYTRFGFGVEHRVDIISTHQAKNWLCGNKILPQWVIFDEHSIDENLHDIYHNTVNPENSLQTYITLRTSYLGVAY